VTGELNGSPSSPFVHHAMAALPDECSSSSPASAAPAHGGPVTQHDATVINQEGVPLPDRTPERTAQSLPYTLDRVRRQERPTLRPQGARQSLV
jgi:hypothetical protein